MSRPEWNKRAYQEPVYQGVRGADLSEFDFLGVEALAKIRLILDAMDWPQLVVFHYDGSDRLVAPFVLGVSSEGNPLLRGYQIEGNSLSGKGAGWRVFQISKMENLDNDQEFFNADDFDFNRIYPWVYKVIRML